ncbi:NAD/NADP-dependent octopine/nopaline dehydrogenase family protein [Oceaniglobus ichthyenteri]|uniref:NAD/NADP-dependent octopine/nopaline dehydrogenase family protein n=1 Tax=Oceaniglobus ichthyenteri TaxID=2136177 RepID=UPI001F0CBDD1|nr:NAD/NADP-dependent octopine/nopaline dehydrogenase family protein [Oceaniglobus ichthyenteri]
MNVGIAGAGSVAFATAVHLVNRGHSAMVWSPSGARTAEIAKGTPITAEGAITGEFSVAVAEDAAALCRAPVIVIALPLYGHKAVMDQIAPHLTADHTVIISSHGAFGALYLRQLTDGKVPIVAVGTTMVTGRQPDLTTAQVNTVRQRVDICVLPESATDAALATFQTLFGDVAVVRDGLIAIMLSNLNPQNHLGIALGNMTRMEHGETWSQGANVTPNVGRLLEALDLERLAIAKAFGKEVRTIFEHFHLSFHVPVGSISDMNQEMAQKGTGGTGPATADSRYVTEDVPYGLVTTARMGKIAGVPTPLHDAGIDILSAMYGRDFRSENTLLQALGFDRIDRDALEALCAA